MTTKFDSSTWWNCVEGSYKNLEKARKERDWTGTNQILQNQILGEERQLLTDMFIYLKSQRVTTEEN